MTNSPINTPILLALLKNHPTYENNTKIKKAYAISGKQMEYLERYNHENIIAKKNRFRN